MATKTNIIISGVVNIDVAAFRIRFGTIPKVINFIYKSVGGMKKTEAAPKKENSSAIKGEEFSITAEQAKATVGKKIRRQRRRHVLKKMVIPVEAIRIENQVLEHQTPAIKTGNKFAPLHLVHKNSNMMEGLHLQLVKLERAYPEPSRKNSPNTHSHKIYKINKRASNALRTKPAHYTNMYDIHTVCIVQYTEEPEVDPEEEVLRNIAERVMVKGRKAAMVIIRKFKIKDRCNTASTSAIRGGSAGVLKS